MIVCTKRIGDQEFLVIEDVGAIPVSSIKYVDFDAPNGGSTNAVCIKFSNDNEKLEEWFFNYNDADDIREFFGANKKEH